jgi:hypothetical protein
MVPPSPLRPDRRDHKPKTPVSETGAKGGHSALRLNSLTLARVPVGGLAASGRALNTTHNFQQNNRTNAEPESDKFSISILDNA